MSDLKLYQFDDKASLGAGDLVYVASSDGDADGKATFTQLAAVFAGVLNGAFSPIGHTHAAGSITGLGALAVLNTVNNGDWSGTALSIANGGTGSTTASAARTALGLAIGTDVQGYSANLASFATVAPSANGLSLVSAANYAAMRTALGLVIGTDVQAYHARLADIAGITFAQGDILYFNGSNLVKLAAGTSGNVLQTNGAGANPSWAAPSGGGGTTTITGSQGRLSLTSGVAVMIADATAQSTVYLVPYTGKYLPIYDGSNWSMLSFGTGISLALNSTDNLAGTLYDIFCYSASGTATLGTGPAWSNTATITVTIATPAVVSWTSHGLVEGDPVVFTTTGALPTGITAGTTYYVTNTPSTNSFNISTSVANAAAGTKVATTGSQSGVHTGTNGTRVRGTGSGTTELELKDGIWTNKNAVTLRAGGSSLGSIAANKATYLGTVYCTANGQTGMAFAPSAASGGPNAFLGLWNAYNRVLISSLSRDSAASWTYAATAYHATDASVSNRVSYVDGLAQSAVRAHRHCYTTGGAGAAAIIAMDRNSTVATPQAIAQGAGGAAVWGGVTINDAWAPSLGLNYIQAVEAASAASTVTYFGGTPCLNDMITTLDM